MRTTRHCSVGVLALVAACTPFESSTSPDDRVPSTADAAPRDADAGGEDAASAPACSLAEEVKSASIEITTDPDAVVSNRPFDVTVVVNASGPSTKVELAVCSSAPGSVGTLVTTANILNDSKPFKWKFHVEGQPSGKTLLTFRADPKGQSWATRIITVL